MEEILKALGPWPVFQGVVIGLMVAAAGAWAIRRGLQDAKKEEPAVEDLKARWELQKAIGHIHENSFDMVKLLERHNELLELVLAAINRLADSRWNSKQ